MHRINLFLTIFFQDDKISKTIDLNHKSVISFAKTRLKLVYGYPHVREQETSSMHSKSIPQGEKGEREGTIEFRPEFALRSIATRIFVPHSSSNLKSRHASHSVTLPTRRLADNNNSFPPKRALIMARAREWAGKPAKRSFVETTTRASIARWSET